MADHDHAVPGDDRVELQGGHAEAQGPGEGHERVLGGEAPSATVPLEVERTPRHPSGAGTHEEGRSQSLAQATGLYSWELQPAKDAFVA
jgi:hypothetical protein